MRLHEGNISDGRMVVLQVVLTSDDPNVIRVFNPAKASPNGIEMSAFLALRLSDELKHAAEKSKDASAALAKISKQERHPEEAR